MHVYYASARASERSRKIKKDIKNRSISERITDSLIETGAAKREDKALYEYGIRMGIMLLLNAAAAILIGSFAGMAWQCILFLIAYHSIRSYAGGYHAGNPTVCFLLSIPMMLIVLCSIKIAPWTSFVFIIAVFCSAAAIEWLAPATEPHRHLKEQEKIIYKRKARISSAVITGLATALWLAGIKEASLSLAMALIAAAAMLFIGKIFTRMGPHML